MTILLSYAMFFFLILDRQELETLKLRLERVQKSMKILQEAQYRYGVVIETTQRFNVAYIK